jgi:ABC-type multidrug transport system fused ATPase/permease subunit
MLRIFKKLYATLDAREQRRGGLVLVLVLLVGLSESAGAASLLPFMAVLAKPQVVESNRYLAAAYAGLGFTSRRHFLFFLGIVVFIVLVGTLALKAIGVWAQLRFAQRRSHTWACRLVAGYLGQPYEWFLDHHTADLATDVMSEVIQVVTGVLIPGLKAVAAFFVIVWLLALLLALDPLLALVAMVLLGGLYWQVAHASRARLEKAGLGRQEEQRGRFRLLQEALGGIKDLKVLGREETYYVRFADRSGRFADAQIRAGIIGALPPLAMQAILFGGMLLVIFYLMLTQGTFAQALPELTVFAYAAYRLMPALQYVHQGMSQMRYSEPALDSLLSNLQAMPGARPGRVRAPREQSNRLPLHDVVELRNVSYTYPGRDEPALDAITLRIPARTTVGLVGSTGSGKTTTVDVILGLLPPQHGMLLADGVEVRGDLVRQWQQSVGYVPQQIFLGDDSVASNIAFGIPEKLIDQEAVERAARAANLHDFVVEELPEGYATAVGERGVRLSGGQRQRIGIARALYRDPDLLILDEATSALDNITEQTVMEAVHNLGGTKTIIVIAHRLSTVRGCDCIYMLERGRVTASGPFDRLVAESPQFRALAELA